MKLYYWVLSEQTQLRVPGNGDYLLLHLTMSYHIVRKNCVQ